jgi:hypothetical protein
MAKDGKKKKEKRPVEEDDEEVGTGDLPQKDAGAEQRAEARKKKKKQKVVEEEEPPVEEQSEEEEAPAEGESEEVTKKRLTRLRKSKKLRGYRLKAQECGFVKNSGIAGAGGADMFASAITAADAKRLMRFVPEVLKASSYDKAECAARMALSTESVPDSAARVTQAHCEAVMRDRANAAVMLALEKGISTVNADTMQSVLRPYQYNMTFSAVLPPKGLIRHAQTNAVLGASAADLENADQEKEDNAELASAARKIEKAEAARKEAFHKRREELKAAREASKA